MRILAIDMGSGTQDIVVFDSEKPVENNVKMILPSATQVAARRIKRAGERGDAIVLTGTVAGGGPSHWALEGFLKAGGTAYATPTAAQTFDDDLERVEELGVRLVSDDELGSLHATEIVLRDLDLDALRTALAQFEESGDFDGYALGCLDHGAAPPDISDRIFRFEHLRRSLERRGDLLTFATNPAELPDYLTRAKAMVAPAIAEGPTAFMDTGPAAALGALHDERVATNGERMVLNLGNMHLLGFHLQGFQVASVYEHHTGEVTADQIVDFSSKLGTGTLSNEEIFNSKGHGAHHIDRDLVADSVPDMVAVTGPQRDKIRGSALDPYFATPFGDMMVSGCFGLLRAFGEVYPDARDVIDARLALPG